MTSSGSNTPAHYTHVRALGIASIAVPPLGCGLGGLAWRDVEPLIVDAFAAVPAVQVTLFARAAIDARRDAVCRCYPRPS